MYHCDICGIRCFSKSVSNVEENGEDNEIVRDDDSTDENNWKHGLKTFKNLKNLMNTLKKKK